MWWEILVGTLRGIAVALPGFIVCLIGWNTNHKELLEIKEHQAEYLSGANQFYSSAPMTKLLKHMLKAHAPNISLDQAINLSELFYIKELGQYIYGKEAMRNKVLELRDQDIDFTKLTIHCLEGYEVWTGFI